MYRSKAKPAQPARSDRLVARESMHAQILPRLRQDIVDNRWRAGERLPEDVLCAEFGVSRTPLRETLRVLETQGLVAFLPRTGAVVTQPSSPDIEAKLMVLGSLEALAAELAAARGGRPDMRKIERLQASMREAIQASDVAAYFELNDSFHREIVSVAGNPVLADMHEQLMWHVHRVRHAANAHETLSTESTRQHERLVAAIVAGKPGVAARVMRTHMQGVTQKVLLSLQRAAAAASESARSAAAPPRSA